MSVVNYHTVEGFLLGETSAAGARRDYLTDSVGSVVSTVDQSAVIKNTYRYKPYGGFLLQVSPEVGPRFCWTGETGSLYTRGGHAEQYNRARMYGTPSGRWTTQDPLWPDQRAYGYVKGNPTTWTDPSGMQTKSPTKPNPARCPEPLITDLKASQEKLCKSAGVKSTGWGTALLYACAMSKMPKNCANYKPPSLAKLGTCIKGFCASDLSNSCAPTKSCTSITCAATDCFQGVTTSPFFIGFSVCPDAYKCVNGRLQLVRRCSTGQPYYGVPGFPGAGSPPTMGLVIHEMLHSCIGCLGTGGAKAPPCEEAFTQALASCLITLLPKKS